MVSIAITMPPYVPWLIAWLILFLIGLKIIERDKEHIILNLLDTGGMVGVAWLIQYVFNIIVHSKSIAFSILGSLLYVFIILPILVVAEIFLFILWIFILTDH